MRSDDEVLLARVDLQVVVVGRRQVREKRPRRTGVGADVEMMFGSEKEDVRIVGVLEDNVRRPGVFRKGTAQVAPRGPKSLVRYR